MTNKLKRNQFKYLSICYLRKYSKLLALLFTLLKLEDSFPEKELQTKVKRLLLKKLKTF